jgi:hypothetical protein
MRYLKWVPLVLFVLLFVVTGVVVARARSLPIPVSETFPAVGLDNCGGKRCLFQIVPGSTTYDEAMRAMGENITRDQGDHFHGQINGVEIRVQSDYNGSQISRVDVTGLRNGQSSVGLRFGQIIEQFGLPCHVIDVRRGVDGVVVAYPSFTVWVLAIQDRITPESPIGGITLSDDGNLGVENKVCRAMYGSTPWRGFAALHVYEGLSWIER